jgi:hypothetical protein
MDMHLIWVFGKSEYFCERGLTDFWVICPSGTPTPEYRPDPDSVRDELYKILAEARAAERLPWEPKTVLLYRTIFPQMTNWLPDEEGAQLRFEFEMEIRRLEAT